MSTEQRYSLSGATMGTRYSAVFYAAESIDQCALQAELQQAVDRVDRQMSTWQADSDLMRLNAAPPGQWVELPEELLWVLATALQIGEQSGGAFDIGVGALVSACGFGPQAATEQLPPRPPRAQDALELDVPRRAARTHSRISLDLNGIAKGFAVDQLARCLREHGVNNFLVGIDGEMRAAGHKADGSAWAVALEKPLRGRREVLGALELTDASIATSGDYRHWRERDGTSVSHTMDPHSGAPLLSPLTSVSVICTSCMHADAWATALLVLGVEAGSRMARARGLSAIFVVREGDALREVLVGF
ncbi:thiamine biosynthesis lipoprotein [Aquipseudomonas alcaligenes]|uniref:FAD:protein FMN transferase n=1 Tax=Aquipseudomonas alcaligenes TaxID=43263 RepID=UPI000956AAED|nr:FAD:protein FMN transferase [Pseudomonas alcaligenes]SIS04249.1 thiamine biosynthesis lipoprotein [Pseudomonas alcaligenes]